MRGEARLYQEGEPAYLPEGEPILVTREGEPVYINERRSPPIQEGEPAYFQEGEPVLITTGGECF